jgi:hypothetical protein
MRVLYFKKFTDVKRKMYFSEMKTGYDIILTVS